MHGYGANEEDFVPIVEHLRSASNFFWIFPRAPLGLEIGWGMTGYAWYPIRLSELQAAQADASLKPLSLPTLEGFENSRKMVEALIQETGVDLSQWVISGFSQGATIATDLVLRSSKNPLALGIWSGSYVGDAGWSELAPKHSKLQVLQTHGRYDPVLSFKLAEELHQMLLKSGCEAKMHAFEGGHEFPVSAMRSFDLLLQDILEKQI